MQVADKDVVDSTCLYIVHLHSHLTAFAAIYQATGTVDIEKLRRRELVYTRYSRV